MRVGIIGGGAAGLAAAYELTQQGHYAEVFEQAPFLGGQASTFPVGGGHLERGYHHLFVSDTAMVELIQELGLGHQLAWLESRVGLFHSGQIWSFSTPMDLLRFTPLSPLQRLRVGFWTFVLQKTRDWRKFEGVTAKDWIIDHMGQEAYQVIWEPLLRGKFGEYYDQISMTWLWGKIYLRVASRGKSLQKERLGYPMGSFGEVFDTLGQQIAHQGGEVHKQTGVNKVVVQDGVATGLEVRFTDEELQTREYDAVISTTPSYVFQRLAPSLPQDYLDKLTSARYLSAVLIILVLDRPLSHVYWMNIADGCPSKFCAGQLVRF
jgi:protoporphyrinogen oxidase